MIVPASFGQQRLWFLDRLLPEGTAYHVPVVLRLSGPLDVEALACALRGVVARHDVLRASFPADGRGQVMRVASELAPELPVDDVAGLDGRGGLREAIEAEVARPFDLSAGPLLRARLLRLAAEEHVLALTLHHAVFDGGSEGVLLDDLSRLYLAEVLGSPPPAPPAARYGDFVEAQRRAVADGRVDEDLAFWCRRLEGAPARLDLPGSSDRPAAGVAPAALRLSFLPAATWTAIADVSAGLRATPFITLLAVFAALLGRYTGTADLVIGTPVDGRLRVEWEGLVGLFANTLPLRIDLSGAPTLRELAGRARAAVLEATARQATPLERIVQAVRPERAAGRAPLFQVVFSSAARERRLPRLPGVRVRALETRPGTAKFDLSFGLEPRRGGALARLEHAPDRLEPRLASRLPRHYRRLLEAALAGPDTRLDRLPVLGREERLRSLELAGGGPAPEGAATPAELVHARARRTPDAPALRCGPLLVTYRELSERIGTMAGALAARGVGPEVRVGLLLRRTVDLVVAMLAVLEAGGAYVPIDPDFPRRRIALLLQESRATLTLTDEVVAELASGPAAPVARAFGGNLAYVIHTSGSTGRPKGVAITRDGLTGFLRGLGSVVPLGAGQRMAGVASVSFDGALEELLLPLVSGACVVIYDEWLRRDPARLAPRLDEDAITAVHATPSLLQALVDRGWPRSPGTLVIAGGEPLPPALAGALLARGAHLWNVYGPAETTVVVTASRVDGGPVAIGRPLPGTTAAVLDGWHVPVPQGVAGELCVGGASLARGYLDRPDLTAERFVPDPFAAAPGARMYRTGDLARRRGDGMLEYRGRMDRQVKIRGIRVELGEVETALAEEPDLVAVAAVAHRSGRIAGYIVPRDGTVVGHAALRRRLRERLPEHLVPSLLVTLPELPRTPVGKVDRRALPEPDEVAATAEDRIVPRTAAEDAVAAVWRSALGLPEVGIDDNFFDLGGHSLLLVTVQDGLARAFGAEVPLTLLFQRPTVRALAEHFAAGGEDVPDLDRRRRRGMARRAGSGAAARVRP